MKIVERECGKQPVEKPGLFRVTCGETRWRSNKLGGLAPLCSVIQGHWCTHLSDFQEWSLHLGDVVVHIFRVQLAIPCFGAEVGCWRFYSFFSTISRSDSRRSRKLSVTFSVVCACSQKDISGRDQAISPTWCSRRTDNRGFYCKL